MLPEQCVSWICLFGEAILNNDSLICHGLRFEDFKLNIATAWPGGCFGLMHICSRKVKRMNLTRHKKFKFHLTLFFDSAAPAEFAGRYLNEFTKTDSKIA